MTDKNIITNFKNRDTLFEYLKHNNGLVIIYFNATWCKPCQSIHDIVDRWFENTPPNVTCCSLDVDDNFDIYAFMKAKRMVNGIPTLLCYLKGNMSYAPDVSHSGSNLTELEFFFNKCSNLLQSNQHI